MDDNVSTESSDSNNISGEFEIISVAQVEKISSTNQFIDPRHMERVESKDHPLASPILQTDSNTSIEDNIREVIQELDAVQLSKHCDISDTVALSDQSKLTGRAEMTAEPNRVGQSVFYDADESSAMKVDQSDTEEELSDIEQDGTIFSGITYLGAATVNAPMSESEIHRNMSELNKIPDNEGLKISLSIPSYSDGLVILYDAANKTVYSQYEIYRIIFFTFGKQDSVDKSCFAFTWSHGDSLESAIFQCHIFRCHIAEAVLQVSACFSRAFNSVPPSLSGSVISGVDPGSSGSTLNYEFILSMEIYERVSKTLSAVPRDRSTFKLRCNTDKEINITVQQCKSEGLKSLFIERCFGVLLTPGKLVRQADMQLLDMTSMGYSDCLHAAPGNDKSLVPYVIRAEWKSTERNLEPLNSESQRTYITVAVDLVIRSIQEPVRFVIETPVSIQSQNEIRIMEHLFSNKRGLRQRFVLRLKEIGDGSLQVKSLQSSELVEDPAMQSASFLRSFGINSISRMVKSQSSLSFEVDSLTEDFSSDGDEPLLSGTGEVSKDCSEDKLNEWQPIFQQWITSKRPKNLTTLVRQGIPEALRGRVWQKLANTENNATMMDEYRLLITKETKCETDIQRDIHRTFPAHQFFKDSSGAGQDALFKVSKAYAVYDKEVGYCQGFSFLAASLLLHMPEEEAFCLLVSLMYDYGLRDLYKCGFENLYLRLYQLNRLIKDQLPKLYEHFGNVGVETHMFASQWFLTLFTARFPLYFVFHILDIILLDGISFIFNVALTLLTVCENDLRQLDMEGILKYIRITLPKKCRSPIQSERILKMACERKVKRLKQYRVDFYLEKEAIARQEEMSKMASNEESTVKIDSKINEMQEKLNELNNKMELQEKTYLGIIDDYKKIIQRQEIQLSENSNTIDEIKRCVANCKQCTAIVKETRDKEISLRNTICEKEVTLEKDPLQEANKRIRELEFELAQAKLAHVEAECKNQDLNHQLNTTVLELNNRNSMNQWTPWLSKTMATIQEKVTARRDIPSFQSYTGTPVSPTDVQRPSARNLNTFT